MNPYPYADHEVAEAVDRLLDTGERLPDEVLRSLTPGQAAYYALAVERRMLALAVEAQQQGTALPGAPTFMFADEVPGDLSTLDDHDPEQ